MASTSALIAIIERLKTKARPPKKRIRKNGTPSRTVAKSPNVKGRVLN